jgi:hypothetical protein
MNTAQRWAKGVGLFFAAQQEMSRAAFMVFSSWTLEEISKGAQALADDPPDDDFDHRTAVRVTKIRREEAFRLTRGDPVAGAALSVTVQADEAHALMSAHLRAFERFQGAEARGNRSACAARSDEAVRYARDGSRALQHLAEQMSELAAQLVGTDVAPGMPAALPQGPGSLPDEVLGILFLSGLPIQALDQVFQSRTLSGTIDVLERAIVTTVDLATALAEWDPPSDFSHVR